MAGLNYTSHNHHPACVIRSKSCHSNVSRSVGLPKQRSTSSGNHEANRATVWASRRYRSGLPLNRRPSTTCYSRSWHSEGPVSSVIACKYTKGMSSAGRQVQFAANSGMLHCQDRSNQVPLSARNSSSEKSCNLLTKARKNQCVSNKLTLAKRDISSRVYISDGLLCRDLAIRSLRNNPKLRICQNQRSKGHVRLRPSSLLTDLETILPVLKRQRNAVKREEIVMVPSKFGYHPRSTSPTYSTLIETKEVLFLELSKNVREMRRDLDGMKARENSAAFNEHQLSSDKDDIGCSDWYIQMFDMLQDDEVLVEEFDSQDVGDLSNSLPIGATAPVTSLKFSSECLRAHINDSEIIRMNIDEVEQKITERRNKDRNQKKHVFDVQRTGSTPELLPRKKSRSKRIATKSGNNKLVLPEVGKVKVSKSREIYKDTTVNYASPPNIDIIENDEKEQKANENTKEPVLTFVQQPEAETHQLLQQTPMTITEINNNVESEISLEKTLLIPKISEVKRDKTLLPPKISQKKLVKTPKLSEESLEKTSIIKETDNPGERIKQGFIRSRQPVVHKAEINELSRRLLGSSIKPKLDEVVVPSVIQVEEKKHLTEKEKFLEMRKRMEERKAVQSKRKENFRDISMLGLSFDNQRERRGKLGNILSSKIDSMLAFSDDDESDDNDDDGSLITTDEEEAELEKL